MGDALRRGTGGGYGLGEPSRAGQITPSQPGPPRSRGLFRHLKSGARGFRFEARSSHIAPPQTGHSGIPSASTFGPAPALWPRAGLDAGFVPAGRADGLSPALAPRGGADCAPAAAVPRGGQITPSHPRSLHLKSGAFGLRLPSRLSHISPPHFGQSGTVLAASEAWGSDMRLASEKDAPSYSFGASASRPEGIDSSPEETPKQFPRFRRGRERARRWTFRIPMRDETGWMTR
jgi:hypothetical protein